jgi:DNA polymerase-1
MQQKSFTIDFQATPFTVHYIQEPSMAKIAIDHLMKKDVLFAIDTETMALPEYRTINKAGLSPHLSKVRLLQVFDGTNICVFDLNWFPEESLQMFVPFLSSKRFVAHYALFELQRFMQWGVVDMNIHCTLLLAKLMYHAVVPDDAGISVSLDSLAKELLSIDLPKACQVSDWGVEDLTYEQIEYAALDTVVCLKLAEKLVKGLDKYGLHRIYKLTKDAQHPIAVMQLNGFKLDVEAHRKLIPQWIEELVPAKRKVQKITGIQSLTAPKLGLWLEQNLDPATLAMWPRTDSGKMSTSADTFADFSYHEIVKPFSEYQKRATLCSTFGQTLINQVNHKTGRLHASYKLLGARTGRLSCSEPNLQNLPRDAAIRGNFIAEEGHTLLCADYSQIELRLAAEISQDRQMCGAYREGTDLHALTASRVLNKSIKDVTKKERQIGKALGLGLLYGLGARKFSHYVKKGYARDGVSVSESEAFDYIERYRETYHGLRDWQINQAERCKTSLRASTPCGKIRKLTELNYYGGGLNVPIQGAAAEVMLYALVKLEKAFRGIGKLVNCVHDEVLIEVKPSSKDLDLLNCRLMMQDCMTEAYLEVFPKGITKNLVEASEGKTWATAK